jgi:hypothetical protein
MFMQAMIQAMGDGGVPNNNHPSEWTLFKTIFL